MQRVAWRGAGLMLGGPTEAAAPLAASYISSRVRYEQPADGLEGNDPGEFEDG